MFKPVSKTLTASGIVRFCAENRWAEKKMISEILCKCRPKNRTQATVKIENDGETL